MFGRNAKSTRNFPPTTAAAAIPSAGSIVETRPLFDRANRSSVGFGGMALSACNGARSYVQGLTAGLLALAGVTQFSDSAEAAGSVVELFASFASSQGISLEPFVVGDYMGLPQILGGTALFLTAARGWARVVGVLTFIALAMAYFQGVEQVDFEAFSSEAVRRISLAAHIVVDGMLPATG
ncbi:MAG: hypothetical protein AAFR03_04930 [Pseudomonadota bacterium]